MFTALLLALVIGGGQVSSPITTQLQADSTVTLPIGEHHIWSPIVVPNGTALRGTMANNAPIGTTIVNHGPGPAIIIPPEARFVTIERLRVRCATPGACSAGIATHGFASNYQIRDVYVTDNLDGLTVGEGNFLARFENIFSDRNTRHGFDIGIEAGWGNTGTTLTFISVFARWNGSWGMIFRNQWGLTVTGSAADVNREGGMFFRHTAGTAISLTTESDPIGMWFWFARMTVLSPTTDGCPVRYRRDGGSVNIINSELNLLQ